MAEILLINRRDRVWNRPAPAPRRNDLLLVVGGAAVYLASRASSFTTGQTIVCDGGATI